MVDLIDHQNVVEAMLGEGRSLSDVENYINASPLAEYHKAALWLLAWAHQEPSTQRRVAKETLALMSGVSASPGSLARSI